MAYLSKKKLQVMHTVEAVAKKMHISVNEGWNYYNGLSQAKQRKLVAKYTEKDNGKETTA